jgi:ferredoxin-NADP reductase
MLVRRIAELIATPLAPVDYLELIDPLNGGSGLRGRVEAVRPETRDAATLVIRPGRAWRGHVPGQYVRIGVDVDGVRHWRAYSITSPPGKRIAVTVKAVADGTVSHHLVRRVRPGTIVRLEQAAGDFTLPPAPGKVLFVTAGSGITPVMGMLRSTRPADAVLVHSAPTPDDVIFGAELRAHRGVRLVERHTATGGRLTPDALRTLVPDLDEREIWACGPGELLDALERDLGPRVRTERFRPAVVVPGEGGEATFGTKTVQVDGATSLLDAGEGAGVLLPSGCRMGICFGCVLPLRSGAVRDLRSGDLTTAADGVLVQTCVSAAAGPCHLDLTRS